MGSLNRMTVIVKDNGFGIKNIIINEPKTYNSLSFKTLNILINIFRRLENDIQKGAKTGTAADVVLGLTGVSGFVDSFINQQKNDPI